MLKPVYQAGIILAQSCLDNPEVISAVVIGDGERKPVFSWKLVLECLYQSGDQWSCLPILHLNGAKNV